MHENPDNQAPTGGSVRQRAHPMNWSVLFQSPNAEAKRRLIGVARTRGVRLVFMNMAGWQGGVTGRRTASAYIADIDEEVVVIDDRLPLSEAEDIVRELIVSG